MRLNPGLLPPYCIQIPDEIQISAAGAVVVSSLLRTRPESAFETFPLSSFLHLNPERSSHGTLSAI